MILLLGFPDASLNLTMGWCIIWYMERKSKRGTLRKCAMAPFWQFLACHRQHLVTPLPNPSSNLLWQRPERPQKATLAILGKLAGYVVSQCSSSTKHTAIPPPLHEIRSPQKIIKPLRYIRASQETGERAEGHQERPHSHHADKCKDAS